MLAWAWASYSKFYDKVFYVMSKVLSGKLPYFFSCKTEFFSFQNNPKNLYPSYKTDLDIWDCLERVYLGFFRKGKTCIIVEFHRTDLVI